MNDAADTTVHFPNGCSVRIFYHIGCSYYEEWFNKKGELHRPNGLPAIVDVDGYEAYYEHGKTP